MWLLMLSLLGPMLQRLQLKVLKQVCCVGRARATACCNRIRRYLLWAAMSVQTPSAAAHQASSARQEAVMASISGSSSTLNLGVRQMAWSQQQQQQQQHQSTQVWMTVHPLALHRHQW